MKQLFRFSRSLFDANNMNGMLSRNRGRPIVPWVLKAFRTVGGNLNQSWVVKVYITIGRLNLIYKRQGAAGTVKFLKAAAVLLQQVIGAHKLDDMSGLGIRISRTKSGLPRIICSDHRRLIRQQHILTVRLYLTIFNLYRNIIFPGTIKLATIVEASSVSFTVYDLFERYLSNFLRLFVGRRGFSLGTYRPVEAFTISKSSPNRVSGDSSDEVSTSPEAIYRSLWAWKYYSEILSDKLDKPLTFNMLIEFMSFRNPRFSYSPIGRYLVKCYDNLSIALIPRGGLYRRLGKLSFKNEAAGKIRVFAIVDALTQWAMKPLHRWLFAILRRVPMDGTFNQLQPLKRIPWGRAPLYSYDLSAATDRLPLELQKRIISKLTSPRIADLWSAILVNRFYRVNPPPKYSKSLLPMDVVSNSPFAKASGSGLEIKYAQGQPMGALSSWAMLAFTHHFIVQVAAWISGEPKTKLFTQYAVLGDDIVLWNTRVATQYLSLMNKLTVGIGLAKSVISPKGLSLEFAKRTLLLGKDVSPVPFTDLDCALRSASAFSEFQKKYSFDSQTALTLLGYGYKVKGAAGHGVIRNSRINFANFWMADRPVDMKSLLDFIQLNLDSIISIGYPTDKNLEKISLLVSLLQKQVTKDRRQLQLDYDRIVTSGSMFGINSHPVLNLSNYNPVYPDKPNLDSAGVPLLDEFSKRRSFKSLLHGLLDLTIFDPVLKKEVRLYGEKLADADLILRNLSSLSRRLGLFKDFISLPPYPQFFGYNTEEVKRRFPDLDLVKVWLQMGFNIHRWLREHKFDLSLYGSLHDDTTGKPDFVSRRDLAQFDRWLRILQYARVNTLSHPSIFPIKFHK